MGAKTAKIRAFFAKTGLIFFMSCWPHRRRIDGSTGGLRGSSPGAIYTHRGPAESYRRLVSYLFILAFVMKSLDDLIGFRNVFTLRRPKPLFK